MNHWMNSFNYNLIEIENRFNLKLDSKLISNIKIYFVSKTNLKFFESIYLQILCSIVIWLTGRSRDYDLRCRYWAFLFDNLNRAVDEIYQNCEKDESIVECKEAIMVLDNYTREFQGLIQWLNLNIDYESTPPPNRPNSLCWEVRKSQSNKQMTFWNTFFNRNSINYLYISLIV